MAQSTLPKSPTAFLLMLMLLGSLLVIFLPTVALAAPCGAGGITVTADTTLATSYTGCPTNGITILATDITLNCNGFSLTGTSSNTGVGITIASPYLYDTIENCHISHFMEGIVISHSNYNIFSKDYSMDSLKGSGFEVINSNYTILVNDQSTGNPAYGFMISGSSMSNQLVLDSATSNKGSGFYLNGGSSDILVGNTATTNLQNGFLLNSQATLDNLTSNTAKANMLNGFSLNSTGFVRLIANTATSNKMNGYNFNFSIIDWLASDTAQANAVDGFYFGSSSYANEIYASLSTNNFAYGYYDASRAPPGLPWAGYPSFGTYEFYYGDIYKGNTIAGSSPVCSGPVSECLPAGPHGSGYW